MKCAYLQQQKAPKHFNRTTSNNSLIRKDWRNVLSYCDDFQEVLEFDFAKKAIFFDIGFFANTAEWHCKMASRNSFQLIARILTGAHFLIVFLSNYKIVFLSNYRIVFLFSRNFVEWQGNITFQEPLITKKQKSDKFRKQKHQNRRSSHALANSQLRKSFRNLRLGEKFEYFKKKS